MTEAEGQKDSRSQRGWRSQVVENWNSDGYHEWFFACIHLGPHERRRDNL